MPDIIQTILLITAWLGVLVLAADFRSRPAQRIADAFYQLPLAPAHGIVCLPASLNIEDRRDPIAVLVENN